jgi:serine/threonine protein phosphatase PrpC
MNIGHCFYIGRDHQINEDYALSGINPESGLAYAVVCDGCSASQDVDFGARLLAFAAKDVLLTNDTLDETEFGKSVINKASHIFKEYPHLHPQALDATLLVAWIKDKQLTVYAYGDGAIIHRSKEEFQTIHLELTSGAPDYLSYFLDKNRLTQYMSIPTNMKLIRTNYIGGNAEYVPLTPYVLKCEVKTDDVISLISDGINSFRKSDNTPIPWQDLVDEFTGFKNFEGEFVLRRISAFKRKCLKEGITHSDDISIASITV